MEDIQGANVCLILFLAGYILKFQMDMMMYNPIRYEKRDHCRTCLHCLG